MKPEIAIIGTGMTGMMQALLLADKEIPVTLIGPAPILTEDQRTTAVMNPGIETFKQLGMWNELKSAATPLATMELIDGDKPHLFDASEIDELQFGFNISNTALKKAFNNKLQKNKFVTWHKITAHKPKKISGGWRIALDNAKTIECALLIGADGHNSMTREAANIPLQQKEIDQCAWVGVLQCEKPHYGTTVEWYRQGGPMTLVPVEKNKFAMVWCGPSTKNDNRLQRKKMIEDELASLTKNRFGKIMLTTIPQPWKIRPMITSTLIGDQCALIGEAAHVLPPIGAQGFNLGLQDATALTTVLTLAKNTGQRFSNPVLLAKYNRRRYQEIALRYQVTNTLNTTLLSSNFILHRLRRFSLSTLQQLTFLKKQVMHKGMVQTA